MTERRASSGTHKLEVPCPQCGGTRQHTDPSTGLLKTCDYCGQEGYTPGKVSLSRHNDYVFEAAKQRTEPPTG